MRKQQRKQNKPSLEGLKTFCRVEMKVFLIGCLLFLFLLIHHDNKVHWESAFILIHVQRDDDDDDLDRDDINVNVHLWLSVLAELRYHINKQIPVPESERF